ncbi:hypothetical protein BCR32DRAFT_268835 [Anaeromyces robustus]|uniref:CoA-dependent acyltransferase n=1 Tax=Anaeromyces robustus TaxID=1754192 RepID=A0A1Y1X3Y3_9FUNG|nr:hypothetical protein BCR32DRAFT_268835 [Anaeromyces robustus]|eukprot:ORX80519.1 hypothetical protein BCR32DRAFT_268835 [Anaeromyces robustus]
MNTGNILRSFDTVESTLIDSWLSASVTIPKSSISIDKCLQNLKKNYNTILNDYPTLRLKVVNKDNKRYWCNASNDEIKFDNLIQVVKDAPINDDVPKAYKLDTPLWRVHLSPFEDKVKIKATVNHGICDGRSVFEILDIFTSYATGKELNEKLKNAKNQPSLYKYGKKDWFTETITNHKTDPYKDLNLKTFFNPPVPLPNRATNVQWNVPYPPIEKFCKKHNVTTQAILMAIQNEAIRKFHKGKYDNTDIPILIPIDNRKSPYTTNLFKKSIFFPHIGFVLPFMEKESDMYKNIKNCAELLKDKLATTESCDGIYNYANTPDKDKNALNFPKTYPHPLTHLFASHIGLVGVGYNDIQFRLNSRIFKNLYWPNLYGYHNKGTFSFLFTVPSDRPEGFFENVKETSLKYYKYILEDLKKDEEKKE